MMRSRLLKSSVGVGFFFLNWMRCVCRGTCAFLNLVISLCLACSRDEKEGVWAEYQIVRLIVAVLTLIPAGEGGGHQHLRQV